MKKSEIWQSIWIPIIKRFPPEDSTKQVLTWNYHSKIPIIIQSDLARYSAIALLENKKVSWDRQYSHWCFVYSPIGGEHEQKRKRSKSSSIRKRVRKR